MIWAKSEIKYGNNNEQLFKSVTKEIRQPREIYPLMKEILHVHAVCILVGREENSAVDWAARQAEQGICTEIGFSRPPSSLVLISVLHGLL